MNLNTEVMKSEDKILLTNSPCPNSNKDCKGCLKSIKNCNRSEVMSELRPDEIFRSESELFDRLQLQEK